VPASSYGRKEVKNMKDMLRDMLRKLKEQKGATAVEYGMMVALIAAIIVGTVTLLGTAIDNAFNTIVTAL
jgi:pilus assembly protein Flp/PilA